MASTESNPFLPDVEFADEPTSTSTIGNSFNTASHPIVCFYHVSFKAVAIFFYLFGGLIISDSVAQTVIVILMNAMDFYMVKNFSGRYLAGLRWWSVTSSDGSTNNFRFEKTNHPEKIGKADSRIFWTFTVLDVVIWLFFSITAFFGLKLYWMIVSILGLCMSGYNLYAYIQAAKDSKTVMSMFTLIPKAVTQKAVETLGSAAMSVARNTLNVANV